ncbi:MAG: hypothetical protein GEU78_05845 [Actinobacteria bacterium]|nr:hypothetical protein [Actinomycetota bacterium]
MSYEDRLRTLLQQASGALPDGPRVDRDDTIRKAKRDHHVNMAVAGIAAAAALAIGAISGSVFLGGDDLRPPPPIGPPAPERSAEPTSTPTPTPTGPPDVSCSATGMSPEPSEQDLPTAVARLRAQIVEAAVLCDYRELARLGTGGDGFSYGAGSGDPARYWERLERDPDGDEEPMALLVGTLELPHCVERATSAGVTLYAWPGVQCSTSTDEDYDSLVESGLYTEQQVRAFKDAGGFLGWRIGITEEGDWLYFTAGD